MNTRVILNVMNQPGIRWVSAVGATIAETCVRGRPTVVQPLREGVFLHRHIDGKIILPDVISKMTPARQEDDTHDIFCYGYKPQAGDTILDIGAGYGEETVTFSRLVGPLGRVISVEAHPVTFRQLLLTCRYNKLGNVTAVQAAVIDAESTVRIDDRGPQDLGYQAATLGGTGGTEVRATTIDRIIDDYGCDQVDLLKMNIEGAERLAVRGMEYSLSQIRNVVVSCHDFIPQNSGISSDWFATYDAVTAYLSAKGFTLAEQRVNDPRRPWVHYYVYGSRIL